MEDYAIDYAYVVANTKHSDRWDEYSLERENPVHSFGYRRVIHKCIHCSPRPRPPRRRKAIHYFPLLEGNFVESSSSSPMTLGSNAVLSSSWVRIKRRLVPLQVTPRPLSGQSWVVGAQPMFEEVPYVPKLAVSNDGVSSSGVRFIFLPFVRGSSPTSLRGDVCVKYTIEQG